MARNPEKEHLDIHYKDNNVTAVYRKDKRSYPIRIARTSNWDRAILRMIHANMRLNGITSLTAIDIIAEEFKDLIDKKDPARGYKFAEYMNKLKNKEWEKLGVNV